MIKNFFKILISRFVYLLVGLSFAVAIIIVQAAISSTTVTSGSPLTAARWNTMIADLTNLDSRISAMNGFTQFTGGAGPFCMFTNACPAGYTDQGMGGYLFHTTTGTCPYMTGGVFNFAWTWCHPRVCCK